LAAEDFSCTIGIGIRLLSSPQQQSRTLLRLLIRCRSSFLFEFLGKLELFAVENGISYAF